MESSSEDSFLWTDASSDNCDNLMAEETDKINSDHQLNRKMEQDDTSNYKLPGAQEVWVKEEKCTDSSKKKRKIKLEPESEVDKPKKKKKSKQHDMNDNQGDLQKSIPYDNSYLDTKVKQEMFTAPVSGVTKMKKKRDSETSYEAKESPSSTIIYNKAVRVFDKDVSEDQSQEVDFEENCYSKPKKKKKKSKKIYSTDDVHTDDNNIIVEDKFTAEETIVGYRQELKTETNSTSPNKKHNGTLRESGTFQEDSEVSCDEISEIKGDEDHNLHSTLFANRSIEHETSTRKSTNSDHENSTVEGNISISSKQYKPRTQRISDRIRFEEEDDTTQTINMENCTGKPHSKKSSKVNRHLKTNTHLKPLTQHLNISSIITKNDDIWLLKCPKDIDVSAFKDISLKIDGKYKIKINGQSYDSIAKEEESGSVTVLSIDNNEYQLKNIPLSGTINLRNRIPKPHFQDDNVLLCNQTNFIPLPETKCRHPLFGSNYKKALKIPSAIAERLTTQISVHRVFDRPEKKKKKKKDKKDNSLNVDPEGHTEVNEESLKAEPELSPEIKEKKKKRKIILEDECSAKKKRIKYDPESAEAWESEKTIEENLFNF